jgi:hypothetical protein
MMITRAATGVMACLTLSLLAGCSYNQSLVRGQTPAPSANNQVSTYSTEGPVVSEGPYYGMEQQHPFPYNTLVARGVKWHVNNRTPQDEYPNCYKNGELPTWNGSAWAYEDGTPFWGWAPTHQYSFNYKVPANLVYPNPSPTPAGMTMYPYYTHKGPDCFFHQ